MLRDSSPNSSAAKHVATPECGVLLKGPMVQFTRFADDRLNLLSAHTTEIGYVAISHVWGTTEWLQIPGIEREVLASRSKAESIEMNLLTLVGNSAFWMDTVTVNQRNQAEVISTVQSIPAIFGDAT